MTDTDIQLRFKGIEDTLESIKATGESTLTQARTTNGKVAELSKWKERASGAAWAFGLCLVLIIVPLSGFVLYNQVTETDRIQAAVATYFSENYSSIEINHGN